MAQDYNVQYYPEYKVGAHVDPTCSMASWGSPVPALMLTA